MSVDSSSNKEQQATEMHLLALFYSRYDINKDGTIEFQEMGRIIKVRSNLAMMRWRERERGGEFY